MSIEVMELLWGAGQIRKQGKGGRLIVAPITSTIREILWPLRGIIRCSSSPLLRTAISTRQSRRYTYVAGQRYEIGPDLFRSRLQYGAGGHGVEAARSTVPRRPLQPLD